MTIEWFEAAPTKDDLRQGDVCRDLVVPVWKFNSVQTLLDATGARTSVQVGVHAKGQPIPVLICSHDCELDNEAKNRSGIVVAPMVPAPFSAGDERLDVLLKSRLPRPSEADPTIMVYDFLHLWPVGLEVDGHSGDDVVLVADFSAMTSMAPAAKATAYLRRLPRMEMTDAGRAAFRRKLGAFFVRSDEQPGLFRTDADGPSNPGAP